MRNLNIKDGYFDGRDMLYVAEAFAEANKSKAARALDVLTVRTGSNLGDSCVLPSTFHNCHTFTTLITTPLPHVLNPQFLRLYMSSSSGKTEMSRLEVGGAKGNLNTGNLKHYRIPVPPLLEQQAIATTMGDVDALLGALDALITKKRALKQAAMHQLLTGKTRLPGFNGKWETKLLGNFVVVRNQKVFPSQVDPDTTCVELEHLGQGDGRLRASSTARHSISAKYRFLPGDVLFGRLRPYLRKFWLADRAGICTTEVWPLTADPSQAVSGFLQAVVQTFGFLEAASVSYGTHMPRAEWAVVGKLQVGLPRLDEQQALASVFGDMDAEIAALEQRRDKTFLLKQGMMQELLTGKARLV